MAEQVEYLGPLEDSIEYLGPLEKPLTSRFLAGTAVGLIGGGLGAVGGLREWATSQDAVKAEVEAQRVAEKWKGLVPMNAPEQALSDTVQKVAGYPFEVVGKGVDAALKYGPTITEQGAEYIGPLDMPENILYPIRTGAQLAAGPYIGKGIKAVGKGIKSAAESIKEVRGIPNNVEYIGPIEEMKATEVNPVETIAPESTSPEIVQPGATSRVAEPLTPEGNIAKAASDINKLLAEKGLETLPEEELARYTPTTKAAQVEKIATLMDDGTARDMAVGKTPIPEGVMPQALFETVKRKAIAESDVDTLHELASSPLAAERSLAAQKLGAAGYDRTPILEDPVKVMQDVQNTRTEDIQRRTGKKPDATVQVGEVERLSKEVDVLQKALDDHIAAAKAIDILKAEVAKEKRQAKRVVKTTELDVELDSLAKELNKTLGGQLNVGLDPTAIAIIGKMAKNRIHAGVIKVEALVDHIYTAIKKFGIEVSKREIRDAVSGYGVTTHPSTDPIKAAMREVKAEGRLISALEDAEAGVVPEKSGFQRGQASETVKDLTQKVKEKMREKGLISDKTTEEKWRTQLQSYKARLKTEERRLNEKLNNLDLTKVEKRKIELDPEALALQRQRDRAKTAHKAAQEKIGTVTKEEAAKITELSKSVSDARGITEAAIAKGEKNNSYGVARVLFENYVNDLKGMNRPIKEVIKGNIQETKVQWKENKVKASLKVVGKAAETLTENSIALVATLDNSFIGRQGWKTLWTHPTAWWNGAKNSFIDFAKVIGGKKAHDALMTDVYSRENFLNGSYEKAKIIAKNEEQFPTTLPERIPGVGRVFKASEVAFTGSALRMRTSLYDLISKNAKESGVNVLDPQFITSNGQMINSLTARGQWGKRGEPTIVRIILWAPKMLKANIDVLTGHWGGAGLEHPWVRKQAAYNLIKLVAQTAVMMNVANALVPGSAETDPRSSTFGFIKVGDTYFDITGGAASIITLATRMSTHLSNMTLGTDFYNTKNATTGQLKQYGHKFKDTKALDALYNFLENKTSPPTRVVVDLLKGEHFGGQEFNWGQSAYGAFTPISLQNVIQLKDDASADRVAGAILDGVGINAKQYQQKVRR
jgi:hypothetical protein